MTAAGVQGLHVVEDPEDRAQRHPGALGDQLRGGLDHALGQQVEQGVDRQVTAALASGVAAVLRHLVEELRQRRSPRQPRYRHIEGQYPGGRGASAAGTIVCGDVRAARSAARTAARASDEPTRKSVGGLAVAVGDGPAYGGDVAVCRLQEAAATGRKVVVDHREPRTKGLEVDEVQVGGVPGGEHPPVEQADGGGGALQWRCTRKGTPSAR